MEEKMNYGIKQFYIHFLETVSKLAPTVYVSGCSSWSNRTAFERSSSELQLGVYAPTLEYGYGLLFILRTLVDKEYNLLNTIIQNSNTSNLFKAVNNYEPRLGEHYFKMNTDKTQLTATRNDGKLITTTDTSVFYTAQDLLEMLKQVPIEEPPHVVKFEKIFSIPGERKYDMLGWKWTMSDGSVWCLGIENELQCCESWYAETTASEQKWVGMVFKSAQLLERSDIRKDPDLFQIFNSILQHKMSYYEEDGWSENFIGLCIQTLYDTFYFVVENLHNGYYSHTICYETPLTGYQESYL